MTVTPVMIMIGILGLVCLAGLTLVTLSANQVQVQEDFDERERP